MTHILLLGAGFSANWHAPVSRDLFNWLLERPEIAADGHLKKLLWNHKTIGGFESALSQVQTDYLLSPSAENKARLVAFQDAVNAVFADIDAGFARRVGWDFTNDRDRSLAAFLVRFDAIFSLNQDLLVERFYVKSHNVVLASNQRWNGCIIPGMRETRYDAGLYDIGQSTWSPDPGNFVVPERSQPYFKLHGSYRWVDGTGDGLMIIGGGKSSAINSHRVLKWYFSEFERYLNCGEAHLMVIGYGFGDRHVNDALAGAERNGLRIFIVDPVGVDVANPTRALPYKMPNPFENIIESASQIELSQTFGDNVIEYTRLMRFFGGR